MAAVTGRIVRSAARAGFTLLEVALAVSLVVTLSVVTYVSLNSSQTKVADTGQEYQDDYLGTIESLLDEADTDTGTSSVIP